jgi:hypothetical protein
MASQTVIINPTPKTTTTNNVISIKAGNKYREAVRARLEWEFYLEVMAEEDAQALRSRLSGEPLDEED